MCYTKYITGFSADQKSECVHNLFFFFQVMSFSYNMASFQPFLSVLSDLPAFWRGNRFIGLLVVCLCFVILFLINLVY